MGSVGNQNLWPPYNSSKGCTQSICSIYCPQWCYINLPPPPSDDDSGTPFSPLIIAIIGILAIGFLLVSYYTIVTKFCRRRNDQNMSVEPEESLDQMAHDQWPVASAGLDEALIKNITVCKYKKGDGLIEGTECAVCLSEFQENESLRLLPKCIHAFHLPCIDTWLKTHSNCPLCRVDVTLIHPVPPPATSSQNSSSLNVSSLEIHRPDDLVLVVEDQERNCRDDVVLNIVGGDVPPKNPLHNVRIEEDSETINDTAGSAQENVKQFGRPISTRTVEHLSQGDKFIPQQCPLLHGSGSLFIGTFSSPRQLLIADILKTEESGEGLQVENRKSWKGTSSSRRVLEEEESKSCTNNNREWELMRSPVAMKRSISTGRFTLTVHNQGKNSVISH